jgi:hypothetical protein
MLQKIKNKLAIAVLALGLLSPTAATLAVPATGFAQAEITNSVCTGANTLTVTSTPESCDNIEGGDEGSFNALLTKIINIISVIVGVVAVIMIIIGGFRYITSGGSPDKVTGAKNTILYGIIGLIVVALAQVIVRFVLKNVSGAVTQ